MLINKSLMLNSCNVKVPLPPSPSPPASSPQRNTFSRTGIDEEQETLVHSLLSLCCVY